MAKRKRKPKYRDPDVLYKCPECGFIGPLDDYDVMGLDEEIIACSDEASTPARRNVYDLFCNACGTPVDPIAVEEKQPTLF
jgi:predicted RNA-binding Zn-ribbon protein involved in translation (DUF1610 family)